MGRPGWIFFKDLTKTELEAELKKIDKKLESVESEDEKRKLTLDRLEICKELKKR